MIAFAVVSTLLAALLVFAAARKLSHRPDVVATYARVGVAEERLNGLAVILLAGAVGLVIGIFWAPLGLAASACLVVYFALAVGAHVRAADHANLAIPSALLGLAVATLVLGLTSS